MENRNGLVVDMDLTQATGTAERDTALKMLTRVPGDRRLTLGADKNYDTRDFVTTCQSTILNRRTTRHIGYQISQRIRKRVEEIFGWIKTVGGGRKLRYKGIDRNKYWLELTVAAFNLVRMSKLVPHQVA